MKKVIVFLVFIFSTFILNAQNMRRIEGEVKDYKGATIANATLQVYGVDKMYKTDANGKFSIDVPIYSFAISVFAEGYKAKFMEIDGTYMLFILRPKSSKELAKEQEQGNRIAEKNLADKTKAEEQARVAAEKEEEAKRKSAEKEAEAKRIDEAKEVEAKRKAEEQARIAAEKEEATRRKSAAKEAEVKRIAEAKEVEAKRKAEEQARIAAEKDAIAKLKRAEKVNKSIDSNIRQVQYLKIDSPSGSYTSLGDCYFYGKGKDFDIAKAFLCYNLGAKQGEAEAFLRIAHYYEIGRSFGRFYLEQDSDLALAFYEKAETLGVSGAIEGIKRIKKQ